MFKFISYYAKGCFRSPCATIVMAAMIVLVTTDGASGQWLDGNLLYAKCRSSGSDDHAQCIGYLEGILDAGIAEVLVGRVVPVPRQGPAGTIPATIAGSL